MEGIFNQWEQFSVIGVDIVEAELRLERAPDAETSLRPKMGSTESRPTIINTRCLRLAVSMLFLKSLRGMALKVER
jgi:hypothetical protein